MQRVRLLSDFTLTSLNNLTLSTIILTQTSAILYQFLLLYGVVTKEQEFFWCELDLVTLLFKT